MAGQLCIPALSAAVLWMLALPVTSQANPTSSTSSTITQALWPFQTFITEPTFKPPILEARKYGKTEPGLIFYAPTTLIGEGETAAIITTDEGEMIWQSSPFIDASNLTPGTLDGRPIMHYWAGDLATSIGRGYGYCTILDDTYTPIYNVTLVDDIVVSDPDATGEEAASFSTFIGRAFPLLKIYM